LEGKENKENFVVSPKGDSLMPYRTRGSCEIFGRGNGFHSFHFWTRTAGFGKKKKASSGKGKWGALVVSSVAMREKGKFREGRKRDIRHLVSRDSRGGPNSKR